METGNEKFPNWKLKMLKSVIDMAFLGHRIKHVETRWLSLLRVIGRVLNLWPALVSYFYSHPDAEERGQVQTIA